MSDFKRDWQIVQRDDISYSGEALLVQRRAAAREPSVIRLGAILFFSTATGDAWMLDVNDGEAACLARDGEPLDIPIEESSTKFGIAWPARHRLEGGDFVVIEQDGRTRTITGYPVEEIRCLLDDYPSTTSPEFFDAYALQQRLRHTGRNDPCPCGSGKKYKKCCQPRDEAALRGRSSAGLAPIRRGESYLPGDEVELDKDDAIELEADAGRPDRGREWTRLDDAEKQNVEDAEEDPLPAEAAEAAARRWEAFDALAHPTTEEMDAHLEALLALPPHATDWDDLFSLFAEKGHADLPFVIRRIAAAVPPTKSVGLSFLYWNALERFLRAGRTEQVAEIVAAFCRLDRASYDADALEHVEQWLLAAGRDDEALALAEHFLPIMEPDELMPYAVPEERCLIFELRVGRYLREGRSSGLTPGELAAELGRGLRDEIDAGHLQRAAEVICRGGPAGPFTRGQFVLANNDAQNDRRRAAALDRFEAVMAVASEAWKFERRPPGGAFHALWRLIAALQGESGGRSKRAEGELNLLDCLQPSGMERRIAENTRGLLGTNPPKAHLLLEAHADLMRFAVRHRLIDKTLAARSETNIAMLRTKLGFTA